MKQLALFLFSLLMITNLFTSYSQNYDSEFFPLGVWSIRGDFRPVDDFLYDVDLAASFHHTSFENLKSQGFNAAFLSYQPIGYTLDTIIDIAEQNDLKIIPAMNNLHYLISQSNNQTVTSSDIIQAIENDSINRIKESSAVLGYYLYDEPLPGWIDFDVLGNAKNILEDMSGGNHPILSTWNDETHMGYIDSYLNLDVLMMDAYPFEDGDAIGDISDYMPSYFFNGDPLPFSDYINSVRENHCESQNRPLWAVIQTFGDMETPENGGYWRQVYPKEIRLQAYLAIMQGAKGLWYFLYESEYPYLLGLLDVSGQPTQRLTEVIEINSEINTISSTLLKLQVVPDQTSISIDEGEVKLHVDLSSPNQDKYIIGVNTDVFTASIATITVAKSSIGYNVLSIVDVESNESISYTETTDTIIINAPIDQGSGRLLKLSEALLPVENFNQNITISLSPNPVTDKLVIKHKNLKFDNYTIYNTMGEKIKTGILSNNGILNVEVLKSGIYYLILSTKKGNFTDKFIKE